VDRLTWKDYEANLESNIEDLQGKWLGQVLRGYFNYHAVPTNARALRVFRYHVTDLWRRTLRRRSQKDRITWEWKGDSRGHWEADERSLLMTATSLLFVCYFSTES
jgi:hypothetical protein